MEPLRHAKGARDAAALVGFAVLCLAVTAAGRRRDGNQRGHLVRAARQACVQSAQLLFAPVWTTLYVMMALAG